MARFSFKTLAEDLLTLEVNTIVKADMTAAKMPPSRREALLDISRAYHNKLVELHCRAEVKWEHAGVMAFLELYDCAKQGIANTEQALNQLAEGAYERRDFLQQNLVMLGRMRTQSSRIISIFVQMATELDSTFELGQAREEILARAEQRIKEGKSTYLEDPDSAVWNNDIDRTNMQRQEQDLPLDPVQLSTLRKIWEIGTESVVMQTVIHADGDITTRIAERFASQPHPVLFQIHNDAVDGAVSFWSNLVKTISEMVSGAGRRFFKSD